jgi:hypothetical protein
MIHAAQKFDILVSIPFKSGFTQSGCQIGLK